MKTIIEIIDECRENARKKGYNPADPAYWAYAIGAIRAMMEHRDKEFNHRIHELERNAALIKTPYMRRQAS